MNSKCISIIMLLIIVFLLILLLMSKINKKSDTETFQTSVPNPLGELTLSVVEQLEQEQEEKSYQLHEVFTFLKELKLPKELASRYAHSLRST